MPDAPLLSARSHERWTAINAAHDAEQRERDRRSTVEERIFRGLALSRQAHAIRAAVCQARAGDERSA